MSTLLEKAFAVQLYTPILAKDEKITDEHIELIKAFFENKITVRQATVALDKKYPGNFSHWIGTAVKKLYREKRLTIK